MREEDYQEDREKTQRWRITRYNRYKREFENLEKIFTKKHYDIVVEWLGQYLEEPDNAFKQVAKDALMYTSLGLKLKDIADLNRDHLLASWKKTIPGDSNEPLPNPERMTSAWSSMETYAQNKTNLGKLWYGSMALAKNRPEDGEEKRGPNRGIKVWRTILQKLWGIDGIVDMGLVGPPYTAFPDAIIHSSEPTQAVFFSKSALQHVTTIRNTETPTKIRRRKAAKKANIAKMLTPLFKEEYNELYGGIVKSWHMPQDLVTDITKKEFLTLDTILQILFSAAAASAFLNPADRKSPENKGDIWWKTLSELSLEKPGSIHSQTQQGMVDTSMLFIRSEISMSIYREWISNTIPVMHYKVGWLHRGDPDKDAPHRPTEDYYTTQTRMPWDLRADLRDHIALVYEELKSKPKAENGMIDKKVLIRARDRMVQLHGSIDKIYKKERERSLWPTEGWQAAAGEVRDYLEGLPK
jgi:hypothetical protein